MKNKKQVDLAKEIGVSKQTMSKIINGARAINAVELHIPKEFVGTELLESGYSALAECSMLNAPNVKYYATERISQWKDVMTIDGYRN